MCEERREGGEEEGKKERGGKKEGKRRKRRGRERVSWKKENVNLHNKQNQQQQQF